MTSSLVMRPPRPVPVHWLGPIPFASASTRADGDLAPRGAVAGGGGGTAGPPGGIDDGLTADGSGAFRFAFGGAAGFFAGAGAAAPSSTRPITAPTWTVVPSGTAMRSVPAAGATTSCVALSVS